MRKRPAAKYRRISQDREGQELGVQRQEEDLDALAERRGLVYVADFVDNDLGASSRSRKPRPEYRRMLEAARAGEFEVIAAYTTGRLTRRPREFEDLIDLATEHGTEFAYIRSPEFDLTTAQGRRIARTLAAQDAGEAEEMGERVARAAQQRAERGLNHGGRRCYGYTKDGLHIEPTEAAEVARMAEQLLAGVPLGAITRNLNDRGVTTVRGNKWSPGTARDLLRRPRLAGLSEHRGQVVGKGQWPAILTEEIHAALVTLLNDPSRRTTTGNRAAYLLSGIAKCGKCGGSITSAGVKRDQTSETYRYIYKCRAGACVGRRRDWVDDFVTAVVLERLSRDDARDLLVDDDRPDVPALREEALALRVRLDDLAAAFADGTIDRGQLRTGSERIHGRLGEIDAAISHSSRTPVLAELVDADDVRAAWDRMSLERQRAVIQTLMSVVLYPGGGGRRDFDPTKVEITWKT